MRSNGGIIGAKKTIGSFTGIWSLRDAQREVGASNWPIKINIEALVVAGGGGGGGNHGGGGGAGGLLYQLNKEFIKGTPFTVSIGAGGAPTYSSLGTNGGNSVLNTSTALGGGRGGGYNTGSAPASGGSGAGGTGYASPQCNAASSTQTDSDGMTGYGNAGGGACSRTEWQGGGGGGAGGAGGAASSAGGNGGAGRQYSISGSSTFYAGGGGGCGLYPSGTSGSGGSGGGGNGGPDSGATQGAVNTGGGGGGARNNIGASGGSGVVILRYPSAHTLTLGAGLTGSTTTVGGDKVTTITAGSGSVSFA